MNEVLKLVSRAVSLTGAAIITWGILLITLRLIRLEFKRLKQKTIFKQREALRHQLGSYLLLGMEFLIAADIMVTIIDPTLIGIAILGGIVLIRTVISYFLEHEVAEFTPDTDPKPQL